MTVKYKFQTQNKSKLGKIAHFSTNHTTCYKVCKYCYNHKSVRMYKHTRNNYDNNTKVLNSGGRLPVIPKNTKVVRFYMNGDFNSIHVIKEWIRLAIAHHDIKFFGYTKQWQNKKLLPWLTYLKNESNVVLRASVDNETGYDIPKNWQMAGMINPKKTAPEFLDNMFKVLKGKYFVCKFSSNKLKCDKCQICFSDKVRYYSIFFPIH